MESVSRCRSVQQENVFDRSLNDILYSACGSHSAPLSSCLHTAGYLIELVDVGYLCPIVNHHQSTDAVME